jgi:hypothetical protein
VFISVLLVSEACPAEILMADPRQEFINPDTADIKHASTHRSRS